MISCTYYRDSEEDALNATAACLVRFCSRVISSRLELIVEARMLFFELRGFLVLRFEFFFELRGFLFLRFEFF